MTASLFNTGRTPGNPRSTAHACVLGSLPKEVEAPEKILLLFLIEHEFLAQLLLGKS